MVKITLELDYTDCGELFKSFYWHQYLERIINTNKCISWQAHVSDYNRKYKLMPMPGTTDPNWGEKHWGKEK